VVRVPDPDSRSLTDEQLRSRAPLVPPASKCCLAAKGYADGYTQYQCVFFHNY
jgi:hypothetical protein